MKLAGAKHNHWGYGDWFGVEPAQVSGCEPTHSQSFALYPSRIYNRAMTKRKSTAPLTPAVLHILLALATEERHGYGIMKQVEADSQGKVKMGPGTLYGSIRRMIDAGLISESNKKIDPDMDDERRIYYKNSALGKKALATELQRYREVVAVARQNQISPGTYSYGG